MTNIMASMGLTFPMGRAVFVIPLCVTYQPFSAPQSQEQQMVLQHSLTSELSYAALQALNAAEHGVGSCDTSPEAPCVVYVSKMVAVPAAALPRYCY